MWQRIEQALNDLGETEAEVADRLLAAGCLGCPEQERDCPLWHWLELRVGVGNAAARFTVSPGAVLVFEFNRETWLRAYSVPLPAPVAAFVDHFDKRCWPALERPHEGD